MDGRALALGSIAVVAALSSRRGSPNSDDVVLHFDEYWDPNLDVFFGKMREAGLDLQQVATVAQQYPQATLTTVVLVVTQYAYWLGDQQVFIIGRKLQEMFANTDLSKVPEWAIKFPYPAYYLALPDCPWSIFDPHTGWHQVGGVYVRVMEPAELPDVEERGEYPVLSMVVWGMANEKSKFKGDDAVAFVHLDIGEAFSPVYGNIEEYFTEKTGKRGRPMTSAAGLPMRAKEGVDPWRTQPKHREAVRNVLRVIINSAIYMGSEGARRETDPRFAKENRARQKIVDQIGELQRSGAKGRRIRRGTEKLEKKKRNFSGANVVWIGKHEKEGRPKLQPGAAVRSRKPMRRHWVRGHWRFAARKHGERKPVWIRPFQRGTYDPDVTTPPKRKYKLDGGDQ
ncbi:hypothetical protein CMI47_00705 [Candidatus Pacearchaeota archaeon]|nr:hypothetical protein [Candidatus Pacearchaeota archaeon]|tara:strand:+ start:1415 stop:2605 length:1191 start_codon:yes stop_codon:yes gene_type:complete